MRYVVAALLFFPLTLSAQLSVSFNAGAAFLNLSDIKNQQQEMNKQFPVEGRVTSSFPSYWLSELAVKYAFRKGLLIGGTASYTSTGGRIYYSDYSGKLSVDQIVKCYTASAVIGGAFRNQNSTWILQTYLMPGVSLVEYELIFNDVINKKESNESYNFSGYNFFAQPTVNLTKRISYVGLHAGIGYYQTIIPGRLNSKDINDAFLTNPDDSPLFADCSGLRLTIGVSVYFRKP